MVPKMRPRARLSATRLVPVLPAPGGPAAVTRLVIATIVDAVDAVSGRWLQPHVGEEVLKAMAPTVTDFDATTAVVLEVSVVGVGAAANQSDPGSELRG
jgi:hypothetical protein